MRLAKLLLPLRPWLARVDALTLRERAIVLALALSLLWAAADALLFQPNARARQEQTALLQKSRTVQAESAAALAQAAIRTDPDEAARQRLERARQALQAGLTESERLQQRLVAPKDMAQVLQGLLANQPGLRLTGMKTLPPKAVGLAPGASEKEAALYRHGIVLEARGDYASLVRYMEALEKLPAGFYWERAELDASAHPELRLTLTLNTLSLERSWLTL